MLYMNEYEIEWAADRYRDEVVIGPAVATLAHLMDWTNENSDGWAFWPKPCRAAAKLQALIQEHHQYSRFGDRDPVTVAEYKAALKPIKAFRTRQGADFKIVEVA